jgi:hypothetical protein
MRALAFGILDPAGERYQLAQLHRRECPACRAYVLSLRGLAAVLPPLALPWGPGAVGFGGGSAAGAGAGAGTGSGAGAASGAGAGAGAGAGVGTSGGSLFAGGSLGAKLAAGCLLVAGVGGGCVAIVAGAAHTPHRARRPAAARGASAVLGRESQGVFSLAGLSVGHAVPLPLGRSSPSRNRGHLPRRSPAQAGAARAAQAQRELGFERPPTPGPSALRQAPSARPSPSPSSTSGQSRTGSGSSNGAAREFGIE